MKRSIVVATVVATMVAVAGLGVGPALAATPHNPIVISTGGFTVANGVTNTPCGSSIKPCSIDNWQIDPPAGGTCITVQNTTEFFVIHDNTCDGGTNGIVLRNAPNGTVAKNTITNLDGTTATFDATGILVDQSDNTTITENALSKIRANPATATHKDGGSGFGIHIGKSAPVDIERNNISQVSGGYGFIGTSASKNGGNGGGAFGVQAEGGPPTMLSVVLGPVALQFGPPLSDLLRPVVELVQPMIAPALPPAPNLKVKDNAVSRITGAVGAIGAYVAGGVGGSGGNGGSAAAVSVQGVNNTTTRYNNVQVTGNNLSLVTGGVGAVGGSGRSGGNGGSGGSAHAVQLVNVGASNTGSTVTGNTITQLYGAVGAIGGTGTLGLGVGGRGGNGGDAIGIRKSNVTVTPGTNTITFFFAGLAGQGGFPGGANGQSGTAAAII